MKEVWKYKLRSADRQTVTMPAAAEILQVDDQFSELVMWALVDRDAQNTVSRDIEIFGTGHPMDEAIRIYIGTVLIGSLVWHVFERV